MCFGCWDEAGKPQINTLEVGQLAMNLWKADHFGALHVFVEDWNADDENIRFCHDQTARSQSVASVCKQALSIPEEARISALALRDHYWGSCSIYSEP